MPIAELTSLGFAAKEDSQYLAHDPKDPTLRKEFEGGFVQTRARFTRAPPIIFTTGWTDITEAQRVIFANFLASKRGGAASFNYTHPVSAQVYVVRFAAMPQFQYTGIGGYHRWTIANVKLEEV